MWIYYPIAPSIGPVTMISPMQFTDQIIGSEQKPDGKHKERRQISKSVSAFEQELINKYTQIH